ncbi:hypothetical protein Plhal710r2_c039g0136811 [Plasmopara halstedii]
MCNFIKKNGEQCLLARNKERCGKHPIIMDQETIVVESNIVEEMPPQVNTPVVAKVVDTPAPSVIEPVEASNVEVSKVPELDESNVEPVATDSAVYKEEYNSDSEKLYNSDDVYDTDNEDDVMPHKPVRAVKTIPFSETSAGSLFSKVAELDHSWMYETSDDDSSSDIESVNSNVWDESYDQILDESSLEKFERARQAEAYEEYIEEFERRRQAKAVTSAATEKEVTSTATEVIQPTKAQLKRWANLILDGNYLERCEEIAEAENLVLDQQQIDVLQKFVEAATKQNAKGKDIESTLKRDSMAIDQFERKMKQLKVKTSVKLKATTKTKEITGSYSPVQQG